MSETTDGHECEPNDEHRLMTSIDGEEVRLLVHITPIEDAEERPTEPGGPAQASPPEAPGLAE